MATYKALTAAIAQIAGGSQPTTAQMTAGSGLPAAQQPYWYSAADAGTSDGLAGLAGCYSVATEKIALTPLGMVLPDRWEPNPITPGPIQGQKYRIDRLGLRIFAGHNDMQTALAQLYDFADSLPALFDQNMQLLASANVSTADCSRGRFLEVDWGGDTFFAVEFTIEVHRGIPTQRRG